MSVAMCIAWEIPNIGRGRGTVHYGEEDEPILQAWVNACNNEFGANTHWIVFI